MTSSHPLLPLSSPEELGCCLGQGTQPREEGTLSVCAGDQHLLHAGATGAKPVLEGSREGGAVSGSQPCTSQVQDLSPVLLEGGTGSAFPQEQDPSGALGRGCSLRGCCHISLWPFPCRTGA